MPLLSSKLVAAGISGVSGNSQFGILHRLAWDPPQAGVGSTTGWLLSIKLYFSQPYAKLIHRNDCSGLRNP